MRGSRFVAVFVIGALALAACGGDDDDGGGDAADQTVEDQGGSAGDDAGDGGGDDTAADSTGGADVGDAGALFTNEKCLEAVQAMSAAIASAGAFGGTEDLDTAVEQLRAYADAAPDEIADDLGLIADALAEYFQALQEAGLDELQPGEVPDADALQALENLPDAFGNQEFQDASERVSEWFDTECGVGTGNE